MNCQAGLPHFCDAWAVLRLYLPGSGDGGIDGAFGAMGSLLPYRKAAEVMAEFLPIKPTELS